MRTLQIARVVTFLTVVSMLGACAKKADDSKPAAPAGGARPQSPPQQQQPQGTVSQPKAAEPFVQGVPPASAATKDGNNSATGSSGSASGSKSAVTGLEDVIGGSVAVGKKHRGTGLMKNYALASHDDLIVTLAEKLDADVVHKQKNHAAAQSIKSLTSKLDAKSGNVRVQLERIEGRARVKYELSGVLPSGQDTVKLSMAAATGQEQMSGRFTCLDADKRFCRVAMIELEIGVGDGAATVVAVVRKTDAEINFKAPQLKNASTALQKFVEMLSNTEKKMDVVNSLRVAPQVESTEIVNGMSHIRFSMISREGEVVSMAGPLLFPEGDFITTNAIMSRDIRFESLTDIIEKSAAHNQIQTGLADARLIKVENGKYFTTVIFFNGKHQDAQHKLELQFVRQQVAFRSVE